MSLQMGQGRKEAARAVFYRALQLCPWAKVSPMQMVQCELVNHILCFHIKVSQLENGF